MHTTRPTRSLRATALLVGVCMTGTSLAACSAETDGAPAAAPPSAESVSAVRTTPAVRTDLEAGWDKARFGPGVGVVLAPVGGDVIIALGDQTTRVAWSTIKVPLSLAAQRNGSAPTLIKKAIIDSDNDVALKLRESLGTPDEARAKVTAVLRRGGDPTTEVVKIKAADETFGLTEWPLTGAATFAAQLPCGNDTADILMYMGRVADNQQWGLKSITSTKVTTAVKGGWGPADEGGYEIRQMGVITWDDGRQLAVSMASYRPGEGMEVGIANLNKVAGWLQKNLDKLPRGSC